MYTPPLEDRCANPSKRNPFLRWLTVLHLSTNSTCCFRFKRPRRGQLRPYFAYFLALICKWGIMSMSPSSLGASTTVTQFLSNPFLESFPGCHRTDAPPPSPKARRTSTGTRTRPFHPGRDIKGCVSFLLCALLMRNGNLTMPFSNTFAGDCKSIY